MLTNTRSPLIALSLAIGVAFETLSILELVFGPHRGADFSGLFARSMEWIVDGAAPLSPLLLLGMLYSRIARTAIIWGSRHLRPLMLLTRKVRSVFAGYVALRQTGIGEKLSVLRYRRFLLIMAMSAVSLLVYLPYRTDLNLRQSPVGLDTSLYIDWIDHMLHSTTLDAIRYAFLDGSLGSRPFFLLAVYSAAILSNLNADVTIRFLPMVLGPLVVLASYSFVCTGSKNKECATVTAILTAFSPTITVGMWASYFANWLAIIEAYAFLGILLGHLRSPSRSKLLLIVALSLALLFTHPFTWILIATLTTLFLLSLRREMSSGTFVGIIGPILAVDLLAEFLRTALGAYGAVSAGSYLVGQAVNPLSNLSQFWPNVIDGLTLTYDGLLANSLTLVLAVTSSLTLRYKDRFERLLLFWIVLTSISFPLMSTYLQTRMTYNMPTAVLASLGLITVISRTPTRSRISLLVLLLVMLFNANYATLAMFRLVL